MSWKIKISEQYRSDLKETLLYIYEELANPNASQRLADEVKKKYDILSDNPLIHAVVDDIYLAYFGIRLCVIRNYMLFYIADEETNTVYILRFLYARRNWTDILKNDFQNKIFYKFI